MDPFALLGIMAVSSSLGYIAAAQKYGRRLRTVQQKMFSMSMESVTRLSHAAMATLVEDYGHDATEAQAKLFKRAQDAGMRLMVANSDGSIAPVNTEEKKS